MEPLFPLDRNKRLSTLSIEIYRQNGFLSGALHPITRSAVVDLVRNMNSYYSNLIEGQHTEPKSIEKALRSEFSDDPKQRNLQQLHLAHIKVQKEVEDLIDQDKNIDICSPDFFCQIHRSFLERLPDEFKTMKDEKGNEFRIEPGKLRAGNVTVGRHLAPDFKKLEEFLTRFQEFYSARFKQPDEAIASMAASHHRFAWIHPFWDGNGRVGRLFTHAAMKIIGIDAGGLWSISRGFARTRNDYYAYLGKADEKRKNDYDGRGYLSDEGLFEWCEYFLKVALDQIKFMQEILSLPLLIRRIESYGRIKVASKELPEGSASILKSVFTFGEIHRGEIARMIGKSIRTAQKVTHSLLTAGLLTSSSEKGLLRIGFPVDTLEIYFPKLYPVDVDTHGA